MIFQLYLFAGNARRKVLAYPNSAGIQTKAKRRGRIYVIFQLYLFAGNARRKVLAYPNSAGIQTKQNGEGAFA
ncbi:MAG: hypothetical protein IJW87_05950 [Clostridia bacterium]|nr:hypothetical protein [Clostridia bacterium]